VRAPFTWIAWIAGVVAAAAIVAFSLRSGTNVQSAPSALAGETAPAYPLAGTSGGTVTLANYRGRVVVMNLWASWCPPCRAEMPDLERLYRLDANRGLVILGVNEGESKDRAATFARSLGITFPIALDEQQQYGRVYAALGLPTTVVVGRDGKIVRGFDGQLTYGQMTDAVGPLLR
jgi:peroxiredoxin